MQKKCWSSKVEVTWTLVFFLSWLQKKWQSPKVQKLKLVRYLWFFHSHCKKMLKSKSWSYLDTCNFFCLDCKKKCPKSKSSEVEVSQALVIFSLSLQKMAKSKSYLNTVIFCPDCKKKNGEVQSPEVEVSQTLVIFASWLCKWLFL